MSRRDQIRMSDDEIRSFLSGSKTMTIVSNGANGFPHPMPMWFALSDDFTVRMTTFGKSQKIKNLQRDPKVALMAESGTEYSELKGVVFYGEAELIEDTDQVVDTLLAISLGPSLSEAQRTDETVREGMARTAAKRVMIRVKPQRVVSWDHAKLGGKY